MQTKIFIGLFILLILGAGYALTTSSRQVERDISGIEKTGGEMMMEEKMGETTLADTMMDANHVMPDVTMMEGMEMKTPPTPETPISGSKEVMQMDHSMMGHGSYETYSSEKIARAETGKVILFFRATWCPTCKTLDSDIKLNLMDIPQSITILEVDYDTSKELKVKYGVTYQHTLVQVDAEGMLIAKWSGSPTLSALLKEVK